jgi:hypothetical protein
MNQTTDTTKPALLCSDAGYDPIEDRLRQNIRATTEASVRGRACSRHRALPRRTATPHLLFSS